MTKETIKKEIALRKSKNKDYSDLLKSYKNTYGEEYIEEEDKTEKSKKNK